jgi:hypothetical protein
MSQTLRWSVRRAQLQLNGLEKAAIDLILEQEQVAEHRSQQKPKAAADLERVTADLSPKRKPIVELPAAEIPILQVDVGKKYELNTLERICKHAGGVVAAFHHEYEFRDDADGLWLIERNANHNDSPDDNEFSNWHPQRDHDRPALPLPFTVFDLAAFLMLGPGLVFMFEQYGVDVVGDQPSEPSVKRLGGNAGAEVALLRAVCRLIDEARVKFGWHDKLPSAAVATDSAKWLLSMNQAAPSKHALQMFARLEPKTKWRGGLMTDTDVLTLTEAAEFATEHAGKAVTVAAFLRAAGKGLISLQAVCQSEVHMVPCRSGDKAFTISKGKCARLPLDACRSLVSEQRTSWRTYEGFESHPDAPDVSVRFVRWQLRDGEPDILTVREDLRVMGCARVGRRISRDCYSSSRDSLEGYRIIGRGRCKSGSSSGATDGSAGGCSSGLPERTGVEPCCITQEQIREGWS